MIISKKFNFRKFRQNYYGSIIENYLSKINFTDIIDVINNDEEILNTERLETKTPIHDSNIRIYKEGNMYVIYYNSIRFMLKINGQEKLVQVSILGDKENWNVLTIGENGEKKYDIDSPRTKVYNVYTFCNMLMPTGRFIYDERYTSGTWNEYVYNSISHIVKYVLSFNEKNKYNKLYSQKA